MTRGLWVGVLIALPSGAGVALSVLGGNIRSLVGVAISASLLAPAVNSVSLTSEKSHLNRIYFTVNVKLVLGRDWAHWHLKTHHQTWQIV